MDLRRHAPLARPLAHGLGARLRPIQASATRAFDIYGDGTRRPGRSFKWLLTTSLAAGVGAVSVVAVVLGSAEPDDPYDVVRRITTRALIDRTSTTLRGQPTETGLRWAIPKSDRLQAMTATLSARFLIHDTMKVRRGPRDAIVKQSFVRLVARLAPVSAAEAEKIPVFNPYRLYASQGPNDASAAATDDSQEISTRVVELPGGLLPTDDGQQLDAQDVADIVLRAIAGQEEAPTGAAAIRGAIAPEAPRLSGEALLAKRSQRTAQEQMPPNTVALAKNVVESDDGVDDMEARQVKVVKVTRGLTLTRVLQSLGGDPTNIRAMVAASKPILADTDLVPGFEVHVTLVPSITRPNALDPARFSVFAGDEHDHKVTVARNSAGEFVASPTQMDERMVRTAIDPGEQAANASLYTSFYNSALSHGLPADLILQILRIHAYDTDFRRRVRGSDQIEWFFDTRDDEKGLDATLGDLLMTSISTGGETQRFYRFKTTDGVADYYDESGNTSRKFLMRQPVRGVGLRMASGFGMRRHPLLNYLRPHNGLDWAGPSGTPIMAAGVGTIEEAARRGEYGNYVRIRHANGYKTAYAHLSRFSPGISEGVRVTQGQIIGFIGTTGLSAGPHLHYEVHVNGQPVDPMSIQVPRERKLTANQLRDFLKEKSRVDDLLRRNPVSSRIVDQQAALRQ